MRNWICFLLASVLCLLAGGCAGKPGGRAANVTPEGVSFSVNPSEAEVLIDNVLKGKAVDFRDDNPLIIPPGPHFLELRAQGYMSYTNRLSVSRQPKKIEVTLRRKDELLVPKEKVGNGAPSLHGGQP